MKTLVLLVALAGGCSKESGDKPHSKTAAVTKDPAAGKKLIEAGATVVDVRSPEEFDGGHLPQATNIPIEQFPDRLAEVSGGDKSKPVVVYCGKGGRASKAKAQLEAAGYTTVVNGGGYEDLR
jgi:phage shock protein E